MTKPRIFASAIMVLEGPLPDAALFRRIEQALGAQFAENELILVANAVSGPDAIALKAIVHDLPDCTCLFLAETMDTDAALLIGMERAIGDLVLTLAPSERLPARIGEFTHKLSEGYDAVIGAASAGGDFVWLDRLAYRLLSLLTGRALTPKRLMLSLFNREAALHLLSKSDAEIMLKSADLGPAFPVHHIDLGQFEDKDGDHKRSVWRRGGKLLRLMISVGATPIRSITVITVNTGLLSLFYACYVLGVYLFNPRVEAGWTTLSLQLAGMMFLFSLILAVMSEYIVQIYSNLAWRRRRMIVREVRSFKTRRGDRLNIVDDKGEYTLGAPREKPAKARKTGRGKSAARR